MPGRLQASASPSPGRPDAAPSLRQYVAPKYRKKSSGTTEGPPNSTASAGEASAPRCQSKVIAYSARAWRKSVSDNPNLATCVAAHAPPVIASGKFAPVTTAKGAPSRVPCKLAHRFAVS